MGIISAVAYVYLLGTVGFSTEWLSFANVYDVRTDFAGRTSQSPVVGYLLPVVYNVINPIFIARGILGRRLPWLAAGISGSSLILFHDRT